MSDSIPLLGEREAGDSFVNRVVRSLRSLAFWRKAADRVCIGVCGIGVATSVFLLSSTTPSACRPAAPTFLDVVLVLIPMIALMFVPVLSDSLRGAAAGGAPSLILSLVEYLLGAMVGLWMEACAGGFLGGAGVSVAVLLLVGGIIFCFYKSENEDDG